MGPLAPPHGLQPCMRLASNLCTTSRSCQNIAGHGQPDCAELPHLHHPVSTYLHWLASTSICIMRKISYFKKLIVLPTARHITEIMPGKRYSRPNTVEEKWKMRSKRRKRMRSWTNTLKAQLEHERSSNNELRMKVTMYKHMFRSFCERWWWELQRRKEDMTYEKALITPGKEKLFGNIHEIYPSMLCSVVFGTSRASVCLIVRNVCKAIVKLLLPRYIRLPKTENELIDLVAGFRDSWGFPNCGGAIDGSHIPISAPSELRTDYYNRKGWYSVVLQALVDHKYCFMDVYENGQEVCKMPVFLLTPTCIIKEEMQPFSPEVLCYLMEVIYLWWYLVLQHTL